MAKRRIIEGHTLDQYDKRYGKSGLRKVLKKDVEKDETLLDGSSWWLIEEAYYELPKNPVGYWWKNLSKAGKVALCVLGVGAVTTAVVTPVVLAINHKLVTVKASKEDSEGLISGDVTFTKNDSGEFIANVKLNDTSKKLTDYEVKIKVNDNVLGEDKYEVKDNNDIVIKADSGVKDGDTITVKVSSKDPEPEATLEYLDFNDIDDKTCSVSLKADYKKEEAEIKDGTIVIPSTYQGKKVTEIADFAFSLIKSNKSLNTLKSVYLPKTIKVIKNYAFAYCPNLEIITMQEGITSIGDSAFYYCTNLQSITLPNSLTKINDMTFAFCSKIDNLLIPEGVTSIGYSAFKKCTNLETITIPESVTIIERFAFNYCTKLKKDDYKHDGAYYLGNETNKYVYLLSAENTEISDITINEKCKFIGDYSFSGCTALTNVSIPSSVLTIGYSAFYSCENLKEVMISEGLTSIDDISFYGCKNLETIVIPNSVNSIEDNAFGMCTKLKKDDYKHDGAYYLGNETNKYVYLLSAENTEISDITINEKCKFIGDYSFSGCTALTNVSIPSSVLTIGYSAFHSCENLESITINNGATKIGAYAFSNCTNLETITIPESVTSIRNYAFEGCTSLKNVIIDSSSIAAIDEDDSYSKLLDNAEKVFVKNTIVESSIGSYITKSFTKQASSEKEGYNQYNKKSSEK